MKKEYVLCVIIKLKVLPRDMVCLLSEIKNKQTLPLKKEWENKNNKQTINI